MKKNSIFIIADEVHRDKSGFIENYLIPEVTGYQVIDLLEESDKQDKKEENFRKEIIKMLKCDVVVTHGDWFDNVFMFRAVEIARFTGIIVLSQQRFLENVQTINTGSSKGSTTGGSN